MTPLVQQRVALVLNRIAAMAATDEDDAEMFVDALDGALDSLAAQDAFGTEQQKDPRGDFRNGTWSMRRVEGVDA